MPLGKDYRSQDCSLARSLEVLGERWTMLVLRDCFFGIRRFSDFRAHLEIPRAVLSTRLGELTAAGVLRREPYRQGREEYVLTERGIALWPALYALLQWGEKELSTTGARRLFAHLDCGNDIDDRGWCSHCHTVPVPNELEMRPGPGITEPRTADPAGLALRVPHRLLEPLLPRS
jgi:DNA-binding HxlR family transcriptional regulator